MGKKREKFSSSSVLAASSCSLFLARCLSLSLSGQFTEPVELISPAEEHVLFARKMNSASTVCSQSWHEVTGGVERARKVLSRGWKWLD